jgi:type IV pilus assembly protein PilC
MSNETFQYTAVDASGVTREGVTNAATRIEAFRQIAATGLTPTRIKRTGKKRRRRDRGVRSKDVAHFTHQLSVLIDARIPLSDGLRTIGEQESSPALREIVLDVADRIESGEPVADSLAMHPGAFGEVYVETIRAAEKSGTLSRSMEYLSETLERSQDMRHQIRSALAYPVCVVTVLVVAVTFLVGFVVPRFARMYSGRGVDLPMITNVLMTVGESIQSFWWLYLSVVVIGIVSLRRLWKTESGKSVIERVLHRIPYLSDLLLAVSLARFARTLGLCMSAGVSLIEAIDLAGKTSGWEMLRREADTLTQRIRAGGRLAEALEPARQITPFAKRMLGAGEHSGELPRMCSIIARHYERDSATRTKYLTTVLEPVLVVLVAGIVLVVALAVFLPMWDMVTLLR